MTSRVYRWAGVAFLGARKLVAQVVVSVAAAAVGTLLVPDVLPRLGGTAPPSVLRRTSPAASSMVDFDALWSGAKPSLASLHAPAEPAAASDEAQDAVQPRAETRRRQRTASLPRGTAPLPPSRPETVGPAAYSFPGMTRANVEAPRASAVWGVALPAALTADDVFRAVGTLADGVSGLLR